VGSLSDFSFWRTRHRCFSLAKTESLFSEVAVLPWDKQEEKPKRETLHELVPDKDMDGLMS
jgi:hypothetical protein